MGPPSRMSLVLAAQPLVGILAGAVAALAARATAPFAPALAGPVGVAALTAASGLRGPRALAGPGGGVAAALGTLALKLAAAVVIPAPALVPALVLAGMLGRWAIVVLSYGGVQRAGDAEAPPARAGFGEFGWASLVAFAVTLSLAEAIGLVLLLAAAGVTLAARLRIHARAGAVTRAHLSATADLVETTVLATLALLGALR